MSVVAAMFALTWVVLVLLAFAMAGMLRQLRDLQGALNVQLGQVQPRAVPPSLLPRPGTSQAVVLVVDDLCPVCEEVAAEFVTAAASDGATTSAVLADVDQPKWQALTARGPVSLIVDAATWNQLDVQWRPALVLIDAEGTVRTIEPVGSGATLRPSLNRMLRQGTRDAKHVER